MERMRSAQDNEAPGSLRLARLKSARPVGVDAGPDEAPCGMGKAKWRVASERAISGQERALRSAAESFVAHKTLRRGDGGYGPSLRSSGDGPEVSLRKQLTWTAHASRRASMPSQARCRIGRVCFIVEEYGAVENLTAVVSWAGWEKWAALRVDPLLTRSRALFEGLKISGCQICSWDRPTRREIQRSLKTMVYRSGPRGLRVSVQNCEYREYCQCHCHVPGLGAWTTLTLHALSMFPLIAQFSAGYRSWCSCAEVER